MCFSNSSRLNCYRVNQSPQTEIACCRKIKILNQGNNKHQVNFPNLAINWSNTSSSRATWDLVPLKFPINLLCKLYKPSKPSQTKESPLNNFKNLLINQNNMGKFLKVMEVFLNSTIKHKILILKSVLRFLKCLQLQETMVKTRKNH